jgi:predicted hydrolase (HD superfamily)
VGLLHDFDYERWPSATDHVWRGTEILRERSWPERVVRGVAAHAGYSGVAAVEPMERAIVAADELSGFVGACALVRPSRSVRDLPSESVLKKLKDKAFARQVDRGEIRRGAELVGMPLPELVALVIAAQVPIADLLGIGGTVPPDLPDEQPPAPPP